MNKKILILGQGFIGARIQEEFKCAVSDTKIFSFKDAEAEINKFRPQIIINAIGHTGKNVDECELDKDKTLFLNTFIPIMFTEVALRNNIRLIHISSGCIFHYDYSLESPIKEDIVPDYFELFYSRSKIYSERALEVLTKKYPILIIRIRVPLDSRPHPKNLLTKLISYKKTIDIPNSVTYIPDFLMALRHLINIDATGIYNVINEGSLIYPELLEVYKKYVPEFNYERIDFKKLNIERTNLILSTEKLENSGFKVRAIKEVLEECIQEYIKY